MARILSFHPLSRDDKENLFNRFIRPIILTDSFTKLFLVSSLILVLITPLIINNYQIFTPLAATTPNAGDWPQLQHDAQHSGYITDTYAPSATVLWRIDKNSTPPAPPVSVRVQPVIAYGYVFLPSDDGHLYAYNAVTNGGAIGGQIAWKYPPSGAVGPFVNAAAVDLNNPLVIVGSTDGTVYALRVDTGALVWSYQTGGKIRTAPVIDTSGTSYIAADDGYVYALDNTTTNTAGSLKWKTSVNYPVLETPAFYNNTLYVGNMGSQAIAIDPSNGNIKWTIPLKGQGFRDRWITAGNGKVFFNPKLFYGVAAARDDGTTLLNNNITAAWSVQRTAILNEHIAKPYYQPVYVLDATSGAQITPPILFASGGSDSEETQPVVLPNGNFNTLFRTTEGLANPGCGNTCNYWSLYVGEYNPTTNDITRLDTFGTSTPAAPDFTKKIPMISDESTELVRSGNILYIDGARGTIGFNTLTNTTIAFTEYNNASGGLFWNPPVSFYPGQVEWAPPYPGAEVNSDGNDFKRPTPIANGVFYVLHDSTLVAVQGVKQ